MWPFATALLWAALAAIMFQPLYRWMLRKLSGRRNPAAIASLLVIFFAVLVPAGWLGTMVVQEALVLVSALQERPVDLAATFDSVYAMLPQTAQDRGRSFGLGRCLQRADQTGGTAVPKRRDDRVPGRVDR